MFVERTNLNILSSYRDNVSIVTNLKLKIKKSIDIVKIIFMICMFIYRDKIEEPPDGDTDGIPCEYCNVQISLDDWESHSVY